MERQIVQQTNTCTSRIEFRPLRFTLFWKSDRHHHHHHHRHGIVHQLFVARDETTKNDKKKMHIKAKWMRIKRIWIECVIAFGGKFQKAQNNQLANGFKCWFHVLKCNIECTMYVHTPYMHTHSLIIIFSVEIFSRHYHGQKYCAKMTVEKKNEYYLFFCKCEREQFGSAAWISIENACRN